MDKIPSSKQHYRDRWLNEYIKDPKERERRSQKLCAYLKRQVRFRQATQVAIFFPRPFEVDLTSLWQEDAARFVFPRVKQDKSGLEFCWISDFSELHPAGFSLREPANECRQLSVWKSTDLILVPGFAFDLFGARIGSGKGYYDRFLASLPKGTAKWGVCFSAQIVKEVLAQIATDVRMDALCSEAGWIEVRSFKG